MEAHSTSGNNWALRVAGYWKRVSSIIDSAIEEALETRFDEEYRDLVRYVVAGGKRFRGFLTILTAEALGGAMDEALDAAVAIELVHAASLALDDIVDMDKVRRGKPSSWVMHGISRTALISLLIIPVAQRIVERYGFKAIYHVIRAWESTVRGEIMDAFLADKLPESKLMDLIDLKTGSLFKLSTILGAIAARREEYVDKASNYGLWLGRTYQIADYMADYYMYITKRKDRLDPSERLFIKWIHAISGSNANDDASMLRYSYLILSKMLEEAKKASTEFPKNQQRTILEQLPAIMVHKLFEEVGLDSIYPQL
ncbi:MAG: polyprenyl synthetase family protein [Desulfurococcales archaeon]|nr:polyprenyl synthetase family protein [Desulfurococcales archaeon]